MNRRSLRAFFSDERGQSLLTQAILLVPVLVLVIGLAYDLGAVAVAQVKLQDIVDLAVLDAARSVNYGLFFVTQDVTLTDASVQIAQEVVRMHSNGRARLIELQLLRPDDVHTTLRLGAEVEVPMRFLRIIGLETVTRRAYATSTAAFGISGEGQ